MHLFGAVISQGINAGDVKKLQDAGIYTCNGLMMHTKKVLNFASQYPNLSEFLLHSA
jgi:ABC-type Zn uptake system ZnuABC Zn-binding protein ZnuA